jgi:hypothetical protein
MLRCPSIGSGLVPGTLLLLQIGNCSLPIFQLSVADRRGDSAADGVHRQSTLSNSILDSAVDYALSPRHSRRSDLCGGRIGWKRLFNS